MQFLPSTVRVALAETVPAVFLAVQLYKPMSSGLTSMMKNTSSSGMTCIRRSRAAGKSVPPSFCQAICGAGWPSAAHSSLAVWPVLMVLSLGVFMKDGRTGDRKDTVYIISTVSAKQHQLLSPSLTSGEVECDTVLTLSHPPADHKPRWCRFGLRTLTAVVQDYKRLTHSVVPPQSKEEARGLMQTSAGNQTLDKNSSFAEKQSDRAQKRWPLLALTCS